MLVADDVKVKLNINYVARRLTMFFEGHFFSKSISPVFSFFEKCWQLPAVLPPVSLQFSQVIRFFQDLENDSFSGYLTSIHSNVKYLS